MKKTIITFILGGIFFSSITATAAYVYTARDIGYSPSDENWNVTNADQALTSLKDDLNTVNANVTEYKQQITEALADKGVNVDENSTMEDITSGIENMVSSNYTVINRYGQFSNSKSLTCEVGDIIVFTSCKQYGNPSFTGVEVISNIEMSEHWPVITYVLKATKTNVTLTAGYGTNAIAIHLRNT